MGYQYLGAAAMLLYSIPLGIGGGLVGVTLGKGAKRPVLIELVGALIGAIFVTLPYYR
jgi:hypothetical protein